MGSVTEPNIESFESNHADCFENSCCFHCRNRLYCSEASLVAVAYFGDTGKDFRGYIECDLVYL